MPTPSQWFAHALLAAVCLWTAALPAHAADERDLVLNGSFDNETQGWTYIYDWEGQGWYKENEYHVSVQDSDSGRRKVLCLDVANQSIADNQGVKVDSKPIPFDKDAEYRLTVYARSEGPALRCLVEGYRWLPGLPPEGEPSLRDLRKYYKFKLVAFRGGDSPNRFAEIGRSWTKGEIRIPTTDPGKMSTTSSKAYDNIQYMVIHICAIGGTAGKVYIDDVKLEKIK
jgi:hypothetical protein